MTPILFHVSEKPGIRRFEPRAAPEGSGREGQKLVWAIDEEHLHAYWLPRDCPRVTFYALPDSRHEDVERLLGDADFVVTMESSWFERALATPLYQYVFAPDTFVVNDSGAGYYVSTTAVEPLAVTRIENPLKAILERGVELRVTPSLWSLRDKVVASSLQFSCIRMRNARPRP